MAMTTSVLVAPRFAATRSIRVNTFAGTLTFINLDSSRPFLPRVTRSFSRKFGLRMPYVLPSFNRIHFSRTFYRSTDAVHQVFDFVTRRYPVHTFQSYHAILYRRLSNKMQH